MAVTKDDILEAVGNMSVMDLNDLVKAFEEKFGVSAASMAVAAPGAGGGAGLGQPRLLHRPLRCRPDPALPVRGRRTRLRSAGAREPAGGG